MVEVGDEREIMRFYESMSALTGWYTSKSAYFILIFFFVFQKELIVLLWLHGKYSYSCSLNVKYFNHYVNTCVKPNDYYFSQNQLTAKTKLLSSSSNVESDVSTWPVFMPTVLSKSWGCKSKINNKFSNQSTCSKF